MVYDYNNRKYDCSVEALKYQTKREFFNGNRALYEYAYKYKFLDEICIHMIQIGDRKNRCIYCYEFPDNHVYIGLTSNFLRRKQDRENRDYDTVTKYIRETNLIPIHKQLTEYIPVDDAAKLEGIYVENYKNNGWIILNKVKTGGIGGDIKYWTKDKCLETAKQFTSRFDFKMHSKGAYDSARKNGWLNECYTHMKQLRRPWTSWTKDECINSAKKYHNSTAWKNNDYGAWYSAKRNNWFNECQFTS